MAYTDVELFILMSSCAACLLVRALVKVKLLQQLLELMRVSIMSNVSVPQMC
jgi:hypothetical protein